MSFHLPTPGSVQQSIRVLNTPTWDDADQLESTVHTQLRIWNIPQAGGKRGGLCAEHAASPSRPAGMGESYWVGALGLSVKQEVWVNGYSVSPPQLPLPTATMC